MGIRENAIDRATRFESTIAFMYQDSEDNVTVGTGHLIADENAAAQLKMVARTGGADATDEQKKGDYHSVGAAPGGMVASKYKQYTKLDLKARQATALVGTDIDQAIANCQKRFPSFAQYPDAAREALIDMMFNIGLTRFNRLKWPNLFAAVEAKRWEDAAKECNRPSVQPARNAETKQLFLDAAGKKKPQRAARSARYARGKTAGSVPKHKKPATRRTTAPAASK